MRSLAFVLAFVTLQLAAGVGCTSSATVAQAVPQKGPVEVTLDVENDRTRVTLGDASYRIRLRQITDSRCPANAKCIWQGELAAELQVERERSGEKESKPFTLGQETMPSITLLGATFELAAIAEKTVTIRMTAE